jgi:hypothetical protein
VNLYAYVKNDPVNLVDPLGRCAEAIPQNTLKFNIGSYGIPFSESQTTALDRALQRISRKDCQDWIVKVLEPIVTFFEESWMRGEPPPGNLEQLLRRASINRYSPSLTAQQMGISDADRRNMADNYENAWFSYFLGVTNGNKIWFPDEAFRRITGGLTSPSDLPGIIVHELLHVAGLTDPYISSLNRQIGQNCGWGGVIGN